MAKAIRIPDCGSLPAVEGAQLVLRTRLDEMLSFRDAALDWSDPEGVHDMRVATRRLRSIARDFGGYLPKAALKKFRRGVKRLADALGEVRDEDVALAAIEEGARQAPPELAAGFEIIAAPKRARRKRSRIELFGMLEAETFTGFREELSASLNARAASAPVPVRPAALPADPEPVGADADRACVSGRREVKTEVLPQTFREAGREVIERLLRRLVKQSASLFRAHDSEGLHELRIAAKELRYALELFSPCWGDQLRPYAKEIARLQSSLGDVHDCDGWIKELCKRLLAGNEKGAFKLPHGHADGADVERRAALWLFRRYVAERAAHHAEAIARWHAWENYNLLAHLRDSLRRDALNTTGEVVRPSSEPIAAQTTAAEDRTAAG